MKKLLKLNCDNHHRYIRIFTCLYLKQHLLIELLSDRHVLDDGESLFAIHYCYKVVTDCFKIHDKVVTDCFNILALPSLPDSCLHTWHGSSELGSKA